MRRGFALVEIIVVISIIIIIMAMLLPGIALVQKKTDLYATTNVLQTVHDTQVRNARQFGSAGLVYGYSIRSDKKGVRPWVITSAGGATTDMDAADIGRQMFWNGNYIEFTDNVEPSSASGLDVSLEPRTGFVHSGVIQLGAISDPAQVPDQVTYNLRSKRSPYPTMYQIDVHPTGTMNFRGKR